MVLSIIRGTGVDEALQCGCEIAHLMRVAPAMGAAASRGSARGSRRAVARDVGNRRAQQLRKLGAAA